MHFLRNLTGRLCALGWSVLLLAGCSATLQGPTGAAETRTVQLLEHGRHSSLLLTSSDATRVRYAYGDWAWYVEEDTGVISGGRALLRNSQAGLGRQRLGPEEPGRPLAAQIGIGIENIYRFDVPSDKVDALIRFCWPPPAICPRSLPSTSSTSPGINGGITAHGTKKSASSASVICPVCSTWRPASG